MCQGYHLNKTGNHCNHLFSGMSPEEPLLFYRIGHFCLEKWNILQKMWNIITRQFSATKTPTKLKFFPIRHMKKNSPWNTTATIRIIEITKLSIDCYIVSTMFLPVNLIIWYLHWCGQLDFPSSKGIDCVFRWIIPRGRRWLRFHGATEILQLWRSWTTSRDRVRPWEFSQDFPGCLSGNFCVDQLPYQNHIPQIKWKVWNNLPWDTSVT